MHLMPVGLSHRVGQTSWCEHEDGWGLLELKALADFSISEVHLREARFLMKRCPCGGWVSGGESVSEGCPCHLGHNCCISRLIIKSQISGFVETRQNWKHKWGWLPTGTTALAFCSYLWGSAMWQAGGTRPVLRVFHELDDWALGDCLCCKSQNSSWAVCAQELCCLLLGPITVLARVSLLCVYMEPFSHSDNPPRCLI